MYPMNEEPPRSPARTGQRGPVIQKETSYVITETIKIINPNAEQQQQQQQLANPTVTDRIKQALPIDQVRDSLDNVREHIHLPHLSKEVRRWLPVITSVLLAILLLSLKSHFSPSDSTLSRSRFGSLSKSHKLSDFDWDREAVHEKVHNALHGVKTRVQSNIDSVKDHYHHYPDQNWLKAEPEPELTSEERAARLIQNLHDQARALHYRDPTEVEYEPLSEEEQARLHRSAKKQRSHRPAEPPQIPLKNDDTEALVVQTDHEEQELHNTTEYHRAKRLVHLGRDFRTRAESVPHRFMRRVHATRDQFVDLMEQVHDLIMKHRETPEEEVVVETKHSGPYHQRAEELIQQLEDLSHRIADAEHWRTPVVKKSPWYTRPVDWVTSIHPIEWAQDQYYWVADKTWGLGEEARHRAAEAEEEVRHEAARLQELMKHELHLLKLEASRVPRQMKKASKNMKNMPMDMLEHFA